MSLLREANPKIMAAFSVNEVSVNRLKGAFYRKPVSGYGKTALIHTFLNNNSAAAKILLEAGANVKLQDKKGRDAFFYAEKTNNQQIVQLLKQFLK